MVAVSLARLTVASTPGSLLSCFSSRVEQAAQVMPEMGRDSLSLMISLMEIFF